MHCESLVYDTFLPGHDKNSFRRVFNKELGASRRVDIAVGYVGASSLAFLNKYAQQNQDVCINLCVGMQYHEGFTKPQLDGLHTLDETLRCSNRGLVSLNTRVKNHSKFYLFDRGDLVPTCYIGSANLEAITPKYNATYELGVLLCDGDGQIRRHFENHILPMGDPLVDLDIIPTVDLEPPVKHMDGVRVVRASEIRKLLKTQSQQSFRIHLKPEAKSHLNVFHGAPRRNEKTGRSIPRHWYEIEMIPGVHVTRQPGYPDHEEFEVITDDGFSFKCQTQGQNNKNLRSSENLCILGAWIKGRLELSGVLEVGGVVTEDTLRQYGRNHVDFTYYPEADKWYLDFSNVK